MNSEAQYLLSRLVLRLVPQSLASAQSGTRRGVFRKCGLVTKEGERDEARDPCNSDQAEGPVKL
jgi:hypothetical protein